MKPILALALLALLACSEAKEQTPPRPEPFKGCFTGHYRGYPEFSGTVTGSPGIVVKPQSCYE